MSGKYYKFTNEDKNKDKETTKVLKNVKKNIRKNIIKKIVRDCNLSPFMKLVYTIGI